MRVCSQICMNELVCYVRSPTLVCVLVCVHSCVRVSGVIASWERTNVRAVISCFPVVRACLLSVHLPITVLPLLCACYNVPLYCASLVLIYCGLCVRFCTAVRVRPCTQIRLSVFRNLLL